MLFYEAQCGVKSRGSSSINQNFFFFNVISYINIMLTLDQTHYFHICYIFHWHEFLTTPRQSSPISSESGTCWSRWRSSVSSSCITGVGVGIFSNSRLDQSCFQGLQNKFTLVFCHNSATELIISLILTFFSFSRIERETLSSVRYHKSIFQ